MTKTTIILGAVAVGVASAAFSKFWSNRRKKVLVEENTNIIDVDAEIIATNPLEDDDEIPYLEEE